MINELHAAITWSPLSAALLSWEDYVDPAWQLPRILHPSAKELRRILTVADLPEAAAWAAYKFRTAVAHSDLSSLRLYFDARDGYDLADQLRAMTNLWVPKFDGDFASKTVFLTEEVIKPAYEIFNYTVSSNGTTLVVHSHKYGDLDKTWNGANRTTIRLPGTASYLDVGFFTGTGTVVVASRPSFTLQQIGHELANASQTVLSDMVKADSVFEIGTRSRLAVVAADTTQPVDQFIAACLLLAGYVNLNVSKSLKALGAPQI